MRPSYPGFVLADALVALAILSLMALSIFTLISQSNQHARIAHYQAGALTKMRICLSGDEPEQQIIHSAIKVTRRIRSEPLPTPSGDLTLFWRYTECNVTINVGAKRIDHQLSRRQLSTHP